MRDHLPPCFSTLSASGILASCGQEPVREKKQYRAQSGLGFFPMELAEIYWGRESFY